MKKFLILVSAVSILINNPAVANAQAVINKKSTQDVTSVQSSELSNSDESPGFSMEPADSPWPDDAPKIVSEAGIVMEASTGAILYSKNIHDTFYPASITKILTTLIAAENSSLGETVTFSHDSVYDVEVDSSRLWADEGEKLTMEQCLYSIMLESANDAAYAVAEHLAGSVKSFAKLMNKKAAELGCVDSNFVNPHGLPDPEHYTSAYDMALISRAAINNKTFREIVGTKTYTIPPTNLQKETRYLSNHHKFVNGVKSYEGCIGGKTGWTTQAKYTLVTFAERDGMTLISVIMHCDSIPNEYSDTSKMLDYAFNNYTLYSIADMEEPSSIDATPLFTKYSSLFNGTNSRLQVSTDGNIILPNTADYADAKKDIILSPISAIEKGENVIGSISYSYDGLYVGAADIIYNNVDTSPLLEGSYVPSPAIVNKEDSSDASDQYRTYSLKPIIIGIIVGVIIIALILYFVFVELPYRRRRNAYHQKKKRKKNSSDKSYLDL